MKPPDPQEPPNLKWRFWGAVGFSAIFSVLIGLLELKVTQDMGDYGYWLFLGLPFLQGLSCTFWMEAQGPVPFVRHVTADLVAIVAIMAALFFFAAEGACCLVMAFPLVMAASFCGSALAFGVMTLIHRRRNAVSLSLFAIVPFFILADSLTGGKPSVRSLSTEMVIDATPQQIWPYLSDLDSISFDYWLFNWGVAHPVKIRTLEAREGGGRECHLSTGVMREIISEFVPGRRLAFKMLNTPPSMKELNPFGEVHAPHLEGYYESIEGSFDLTPLPGGKTLVRGTSKYRHKYRPVTYWSAWTDLVVRRVHLSVLEELKRRVERPR